MAIDGGANMPGPRRALRPKGNGLVTSPPYHGQRDYGVNGQVGLGEHPKDVVASSSSYSNCAASCFVRRRTPTDADRDSRSMQ